MISQTTESGLQALLYIALHRRDEPSSPGLLAEALQLSPSYLAKTLRLLVKADILKSQRGAKGGVYLERKPESITLLEVVEACQGKIMGAYCREVDNLRNACAFHRAMVELQDAQKGALSNWTLKDLVKRPVNKGTAHAERPCVMSLVKK